MNKKIYEEQIENIKKDIAALEEITRKLMNDLDNAEMFIINNYGYEPLEDLHEWVTKDYPFHRSISDLWWSISDWNDAIKETEQETRITKAKRIADKQWKKATHDGECDGMVGFDFQGQFIINPWLDSSGRFELTDEEASELYGAENMGKFVADCMDK